MSTDHVVHVAMCKDDDADVGTSGSNVNVPFFYHKSMIPAAKPRSASCCGVFPHRTSQRSLVSQPGLWRRLDLPCDFVQAAALYSFAAEFSSSIPSS